MSLACLIMSCVAVCSCRQMNGCEASRCCLACISRQKSSPATWSVAAWLPAGSCPCCIVHCAGPVSCDCTFSRSPLPPQPRPKRQTSCNCFRCCCAGIAQRMQMFPSSRQHAAALAGVQAQDPSPQQPDSPPHRVRTAGGSLGQEHTCAVIEDCPAGLDDFVSVWVHLTCSLTQPVSCRVRASGVSQLSMQVHL